MAVYALNWPLIRTVAWLKRIAKSQSRLVEIEEERLRLEQKRLELEHPSLSGKVKSPVDLGVASVEDWNRKYREENPDYADE